MDVSSPSGTATFLFTDIEGSTQLWERHPEAMKPALARHDALLRQAIESNGGSIVKTTGDGCHAVFGTAAQGITAALTAQTALHTEKWTELDPRGLRVRMGLHTGEAEARAGDYYGPALNRAARLMSIGHGGQILVSATTAGLVDGQLPSGTGLRDLGEHRLKDLVRPEHVYQLTHASLPADFPPVKSLDAFPNNLPVQLTSFVGRERELAEAKKRLASARLLTLIGPGGTGKTRLSLQLGADLLPSFADGVWLVELAPLADPALILQTIASVFGIREQMGMPLGELVLDYLRAKQLLLILDNCEHLVEACSQLADQYLRASPGLKIIASSREALGISGETVYRVPSLSLPDASQVTPGELAHYEAVQLFIERATAANPRFSLTEKNATSIAQICRRLDGIPLALELAAARLTVFSPEQIATRLDDRFKLLTGGSRTALPRQQTLRALIDWSYDMLSELERGLLRRLSVFAGGWTFEAAEAICSQMDVLELLTHLVNKSLVVVDEEDEQPRYRLLETIRQYARDKLLEMNESVEARNRHLEYFDAFARTAEVEMNGPDQNQWLRRVEAEHDNLRVALEWSLDNNIHAALRLVPSLVPFWIRRGHEAEGRAWATDVLARQEVILKKQLEEPSRESLGLRAWAFQALAMTTFSQGDNAHAILASEQAAALARQLGDHRLLAIALSFEASGKMFVGDTEGVDLLNDESLAAAKTSGDPLALGMSLAMSGQRNATLHGDFRGAIGAIEEGNSILKKNGNHWYYTMTLLGIGMAAKFMGKYEVARTQFETCLPMFQEIGDNHRVNMCYSELAHIERYQGNYAKAASMYKDTIVEWQRLGHRAAIAHQLECYAFIAKAMENPERATRLFGAAEILREKIDIPMSAQEKIEYGREIADLKANLEEKAFAACWAEGRAMSMEQAIQFALRTD